MSGARRSVFVGVDGHAGCRDAVAFGAAVAQALGDELVLGHIHQFDVLGDNLALGTPHDDTIERMAAGLVDRAGREAPVPFRRVVAAHHSTAGGLHTEAVRAGAELLVVGSSHRGTFGRVTLGSHSERALHAAPCAVAVVPRGVADSGWMLRRITVGDDESGEAHHAVEVARHLAAAAGATLTPTGTIPGSSREVVEWLLAASRDTDLLVLGSRGHGPVRRLIVGSTGHSVVRSAACPVMIVPRVATAAAP